MHYRQQIFNSKVNSQDYSYQLENFVISFKTSIPQCCNIEHILVREDLEFANYLKDNFKNIVIVGMGGSILNPKMILSLRDSHNRLPNNKKFYFIDHLDAQVVNELFASLNLTETAILFISKSGETIEILTLFKVIQTIFEQQDLIINKHFFAITATNSPLGKLVQEKAITSIDHSKDIGGRFAGFANVGMIPAIIAGLDYNQFIEVAKHSIKQLIANPLAHYAVQSALFNIYNNPMIVLMGYFSNIAPHLEWYAQMIGESLGKYEQAVTPIVNRAPEDYHSQMQLYLHGPRNKSFTLYYCSSEVSLMQQVINAQYKAFGDILNQNSIPLKMVEFDSFNAQALGELMINTILEIIIAGYLLNINPYDQPGIQEIKRLALSYIGK